MMFRNYVLAVAVLAVFAPTSVSSQGSGFALIGQEITSPSLPAAAAAAPVEATEVDGSGDVDFGTMVSLSANGKRMAVGAPGFDYRTTSTSTTTNESKNDAGAVFLYDLVYNPDTSEYTWETNLSMLPLYGQDSAEGIGRYLWLSPNGERLAVRRGDGTVQVYSTTNDDAGDDTATATTDADSHSHIQIGSTVTDCLGGAVELTDEYLVTSCDRFDANRGKVQVYQLVADNGDGNSGGTWELVVEIEGDAAGDRFGWRTTLDETPDDNRLFRLAVSAPNHDDKTGLVRSYIVNGNGDAQQFGQDLKGQEPGEQFGFAIAMSRQSPDPFLAVGVPQAAAGGDARGSIRIYSYSNNDGVALLNDEWALSAEFAGPEDRVRLGRDVAITANGDRAAASTFRSAQFAGLVTVYERTGGTNFELSSDLFGQDPLDRFGSNVALSATGSIIASGSIKRQNDAEEAVGSVRVFLDTSPFCSEPLEEFTQVADLETFFERQTCRRGNTLATTAEACSSDSIDGQDEPCEWQESASSSVAPSASPTRTTAEDLLPWSLEACPCDDMGYCILEPLTKGSELGICISGSISDIELVSVEKCRLEQGSNRVVLIDETGLDSSLFSASYICTDGACVIRTPVDATFFGTGRPDSLVVTGTVRVASRRSRSLRGVARELQYDRGEFSVNVALSRGDDDEDNSGESKKKKDENLGLSSPLWIVLAFLVALVIGCCCCITAKRQGENNARDLRGKSRKQVSEKEIEEFSFN
jgi:hypothetical protein